MAMTQEEIRKAARAENQRLEHERAKVQIARQHEAQTGTQKPTGLSPETLAEAERLKSRTNAKPVTQGEQFSVHALAGLGRKGTEDIINQSIELQVPLSERGSQFERRRNELHESVRNLIRLYASESTDRKAINNALSAVQMRSGMLKIMPPIKGIEAVWKDEWR